APRPVLAFLAVGLAIGVTLVDLMAYFAWGSRETNGYVVVADWLAIGTTIVAGLAALTALAEFVDVLDEERGLAQLDLAAAVVAFSIRSQSCDIASSSLRVLAIPSRRRAPDAVRSRTDRK